MKKLYTFLLLLLIFCAVGSQYAYASMYWNKTASFVYYKNLRIEAGLNKAGNIGIVTAYDIKTNEVIWSAGVYQIDKDDVAEADTKFIVIRCMVIDHDKLTVINELNNKFVIDADNGRPYNERYFPLFSLAVIFVIIAILYYIIHNKKVVLKILHDTALQYGVSGPVNRL